MGDELNELLERALGSYSAAEPLDGLEERVLARVRGTGVRRSLAWGWAGGLAAACLAVVLSLHGPTMLRHPGGTPGGRPTGGTPTGGTPGGTVPAMGAALATRQAMVQDRVVAPRRVRVRATKRTVPVPQMTPEEASLVRFVTADPEGSAKVLTSLTEPVQPLVLEPIQIESLQFAKEGKDETDLPADDGAGR